MQYILGTTAALLARKHETPVKPILALQND